MNTSEKSGVKKIIYFFSLIRVISKLCKKSFGCILEIPKNSKKVRFDGPINRVFGVRIAFEQRDYRSTRSATCFPPNAALK